MQVLLVHNPGAGSGTESDALTGVLREAGHDVAHLSVAEDGWQSRLRADPPELVAVAGGDGTVATVFTALAGSAVRVGVIATGTANNIAHTLGIPAGDPEAAVAAWPRATPTRVDLPEVRCAARQGHLVECVGGGIFAELLTVAEQREERLGKDGDTYDGLRLLRGVVRDAAPGRWSVEVDGEDRSGEYLAVVAMNIRRLGPKVELAPDARTDDGLLDVVTVTAADRDALVDHIDDLMASEGPDRSEPPRLVTHRGAEVRLCAPSGTRLHVDDERWSPARDDADGHRISVQAGTVALEVLTP